MANATRARGKVVDGDEQPTRAALELDRLLIEGGAIARALRSEFNRQNLGRWRKGKRVPEVNTIKRFRKLTRCKIDWYHWTSDGTAG
jgi:hypothetical protein